MKEFIKGFGTAMVKLNQIVTEIKEPIEESI